MSKTLVQTLSPALAAYICFIHIACPRRWSNPRHFIPGVEVGKAHRFRILGMEVGITDPRAIGCLPDATPLAGSSIFEWKKALRR